jgi:hypothetical protein
MDRLRVGAGLGSDKSLRSILQRLSAVGLITIREIGGTQGGNDFTVFLPEEIEGEQATPATTGTTTATPTTTGTTFDHGYPPQKAVGVAVVDSTSGSRGANIESVEGSAPPNTFFNTTERKNDDDDATALAGLNEVLKQVAKEITGRELSPTESDRWRELGEVLAAELKIAAGRTTVSSVPSFLAEHLRRRLWKVDKRQARAEGMELPDEAMKTAPTVDAKQCPDCAGSGWHYPDGMEKGVKKCRHENLSSEGK